MGHQQIRKGLLALQIAVIQGCEATVMRLRKCNENIDALGAHIQGRMALEGTAEHG